MVPRLPVPSRVQIAADRAPPALPLVHRRRAHQQDIDESRVGRGRAGDGVRMTILRRIAAVIAGMIVAVLIVLASEGIGHKIYPPPPGTDMQDMAKEYARDSNH